MKTNTKPNKQTMTGKKKREKKGSLYIDWDSGKWGVTLPNGLNTQIGGPISTKEIGRSVEFGGPITLTLVGKIKLIKDIVTKVWKL